MLTAGSVGQLCDAQEGWVDPVNNLVCADVAGRIAYQCRGEVPVRSSDGGRRLPVAGWDGACEWTAAVPFDELPRTIDPAVGFVMTANNAIVDGDAPYLSYTFAQPFRAERLRSLLDGADRADRGLAGRDAGGHGLARGAGLGPAAGDARAVRGFRGRRGGAVDAGRVRRGPRGRSRRRRCCTRASSASWRRGCTGRSSAPIPGAGWRRARSRRRSPWSAGGSATTPGNCSGSGGRPGRPRADRSRERRAGRRGDEVSGSWLRFPGARRGLGGGRQSSAGRTPRSGGGATSTRRSGCTRWARPTAVRPAARHRRWAATPTPSRPAATAGGPGTPFTVTSLSVYRQVVDLADAASASFVIPGGAPATRPARTSPTSWREWAAPPAHTDDGGRRVGRLTARRRLLRRRSGGARCSSGRWRP